MSLLKKQHRWFLVAGLAGLAASHLTEQAISTSWGFASGKEPPEDPSLRDVDWTSALLFTAATGAVVAIAELMGRQAAEIGWHRVTGKRPPKPRKR